MYRFFKVVELTESQYINESKDFPYDFNKFNMISGELDSSVLIAVDSKRKKCKVDLIKLNFDEF